MSTGGIPLIALEIVLGFGAPLAWAVWQLIDLRRHRDADARDRAAREHAAADAGRRGGPAHAEPPDNAP